MSSNNSASPTKWLRIGPGVIIAAILSVVVWSQWGKNESTARQSKPQPPIIERHIVTSPEETAAGPVPDLKFILDRDEFLKLSSAQRNQITKLHQDWLNRYGPKIAAANQAAKTTRDYLQQNQARSRVPVAQVQNEAAPLVALSGEISAARKSYWNNATSILSSTQRDMLHIARIADWSSRMSRMRKSAHPN